MGNTYNVVLIVAASLSAIAALLHAGILIGGAAWYRFFDAGERMALAADAGQVYPAVVTALIALVLALWSAYALAGAGVIAPLPPLKLALCVITAIYLLRGLAILPLLVLAQSPVTPFMLWSSVICIGFGAVHLLGLHQVWPTL